MTEDKEIYIDGVNVAECGYFECDTKCMIYGYGLSGNDTFCRECKDNPNCYYKQLKRLEQERDRLDKLSDELHDRCITLARRYQEARDVCKDLKEERDDLKQENKELKEIINKFAKSFCNDYLKTFEENKFLNKQIMEVKFNAQQEIEFLTEENDNYRSALEEIRENLVK